MNPPDLTDTSRVCVVGIEQASCQSRALATQTTPRMIGMARFVPSPPLRPHTKNRIEYIYGIAAHSSTPASVANKNSFAARTARRWVDFAQFSPFENREGGATALHVSDCVIPNARAFGQTLGFSRGRRSRERRDLPNHDSGAPASVLLGGAAPFDFAQGRLFSAAILPCQISTQREDALRESSRSSARGEPECPCLCCPPFENREEWAPSLPCCIVRLQ